jgi:hypothetical protein
MSVNRIQPGLVTQSVQNPNFNLAKVSGDFQARLINHAMIGGSRAYDGDISSRALNLSKIFKSDPTVMSFV